MNLSDEVIDAALTLGMDPKSDLHLINIAEEFAKTALPKEWEKAETESPSSGEVHSYYYNHSTQESSWTHPLLEEFKAKYLEARKTFTDSAAPKPSSASTVEQTSSRSPNSRAAAEALDTIYSADDSSSSSSIASSIASSVASSIASYSFDSGDNTKNGDSSSDSISPQEAAPVTTRNSDEEVSSRPRADSDGAPTDAIPSTSRWHIARGSAGGASNADGPVRSTIGRSNAPPVAETNVNVGAVADKLQDEVGMEASRPQSEIASLQRKLHDALNNGSVADAARQKAESDRLDVSNRLKAVQSSQDKSQEKCTNYRTSITNLEAQLAQSKEEKNALRGELADVERAREKAEFELRHVQADHSDHCEAMKREMGALEESSSFRLQEYEARCMRAENDRQSAVDRAAMLEEKLQCKGSVVHGSARSHQNYEEELVKLRLEKERMAEEAQATIQKSKNDCHDMDAKLAFLQEENSALKKEIREAKEKSIMAAARGQIDQMRKQCRTVMLDASQSYAVKVAEVSARNMDGNDGEEKPRVASNSIGGKCLFEDLAHLGSTTDHLKSSIKDVRTQYENEEENLPPLSHWKRKYLD